MNPLVLFHLAALLLLALGLYGLTSRRTLVGMLISVELMLNGAGLALVASAPESMPEVGSWRRRSPETCWGGT